MTPRHTGDWAGTGGSAAEGGVADTVKTRAPRRGDAYVEGTVQHVSVHTETQQRALGLVPGRPSPPGAIPPKAQPTQAGAHPGRPEARRRGGSSSTALALQPSLSIGSLLGMPMYSRPENSISVIRHG